MCKNSTCKNKICKITGYLKGNCHCKNGCAECGYNENDLCKVYGINTNNKGEN